MTHLVELVLCFFGGTVFWEVANGLFRRRQRNKLLAKRPVNMIDTPVGVLVLPEPNDPRWKRTRLTCSAACCPARYGFRLGKVVVHSTVKVAVDHVTVTGSQAYAVAVVNAQVQQRALEAIEGP